MSTVFHEFKQKVKREFEKAGILPRRSFALNELDVKLSKYLTRRNGFYVEAGANDGINQSNTFYFETYLGWRGLLIEAIPELAAKCRCNRPHAIVEQYALVDSSFEGREIEIQYCNLMSLAKGARKTSIEEQAHLQCGMQYLQDGDTVRNLAVRVATLSSILAKHRVRNIDLLSLDVEGFEGQVLRGLDFERYAPKFILVEANYPDDVESALGGRYQLLDHLSDHDRLYRLI